MAEKDALASFDFNKVVKQGLFLKWEAGKAVTLRVLTTDPVVNTNEFTDKDGEVVLTTKFNFVVYNYTDERAQILSATPNMARKIGEIHTDPDFGGNIQKVDLKITPTGEKLQRKYDIQVLPKARTLTTEQIKECATINLDDKIENGTRMSIYEPEVINKESEVMPDEVHPVDPDEPIDLNDIPF